MLEPGNIEYRGERRPARSGEMCVTALGTASLDWADTVA